MRKLALACLLFFVPCGSAQAKDFRTLVLVGAGGESVRLTPSPALLDSFFDFESPYDGRERVAARPVGPYVLVYVLSVGGLPGIPGRFYTRTHAACFSWNRTHPGHPCYRPNDALLHVLGASRHIETLRAAPTTVAHLWRGRRLPVFPGSEPLAWANISVALEMAFGRWRAARPLPARPRRCRQLTAEWHGPDAPARPRHFCLAPRGAWARGKLYPLGRGVWSFLTINSSSRRGTSTR